MSDNEVRYALRDPEDGVFVRHDPSRKEGEERSERVSYHFTFPSVESALREVAKINRSKEVPVGEEYPRYELLRAEKNGWQVTGRVE